MHDCIGWDKRTYTTVAVDWAGNWLLLVGLFPTLRLKVWIEDKKIKNITEQKLVYPYRSIRVVNNCINLFTIFNTQYSEPMFCAYK